MPSFTCIFITLTPKTPLIKFHRRPVATLDEPQAQTMAAYLGGSAFQTIVDNPVNLLVFTLTSSAEADGGAPSLFWGELTPGASPSFR